MTDSTTRTSARLCGQGVLRALRGHRGVGALAQAADGHPAALEAYADDTVRELAPYLEERARAYGREQRFRDAPFWARRHARSGETVAACAGAALRAS